MNSALYIFISEKKKMYFEQSLYYCWFINFWFSFNCICVKIKIKNYSSYILLNARYFPSSINIFLWCVELIISAVEDRCDDVHAIDVCCITPQIVTWVCLISRMIRYIIWKFLRCQSSYWIWTSALNVQHITAQSVTQCGMKLDKSEMALYS